MGRPEFTLAELVGYEDVEARSHEALASLVVYIGEECYSVYRKPTHYKCPICEGNGKFPYKGYEIWCKNCSGSGKLHNPKQSVMAVCKVRVRRIIASIWQDQISIKYKVDGVDEFKLVNVRNRGENNLFKTKEEAEKYCVDVNTKEVSGEF